MKKLSYKYPESSFLGFPKDTSIIVSKIIKNQTLLKLLAYGGRDWKDQPPVTDEMIQEMFDSEQISNIPKIKVNKFDKTYLRIVNGTTTRNGLNPQFRDNTFGIDILCHYDNWALGDFELRPYRVAGEIDSMLDGARLTGIGVLEFLSGVPVVYDDEFAGVTLTYLAIRGKEDKVNPIV